MITNPHLFDLLPTIHYMKSVPFEVNRSELYSPEELYEGFDPDLPESYDRCFDVRVYRHFMTKGKITSDAKESMSRALHDHGMYTALNDFMHSHDYLRFIGVMGGHSLQRTDAMYRQIVFLCKRLTEQGFYLLSGGGPGAMEATHLGAWMAGRKEEEVEDALSQLAAAPSFHDDAFRWLSTAFGVIHKYPQDRYTSLGIPTWLYGHEPATPFATHIAKFFANSIREQIVLTLPFGGIIYTPGSAGTMQEIFQDAVQNHYLSFGFPSPMIFLGKQFWTKEVPAYPLIQHLMQTGKYKNLSLMLTDDSEEVLRQLQDFQLDVQEHPEKYDLQ